MSPVAFECAVFGGPGALQSVQLVLQVGLQSSGFMWSRLPLGGNRAGPSTARRVGHVEEGLSLAMRTALLALAACSCALAEQIVSSVDGRLNSGAPARELQTRTVLSGPR